MKKTKAICLIVLCLLVLTLVGKRLQPMWKGIYREISFYWEERTEAEKTV